ncbi:MAG TPA: response regulator [Dongiaceae bacterium]|jgi:CheY-like chemotaxis protein|nr:response regulator [Dongiaceae bacterium]
MAESSQNIVDHLPYLRRYARALTGSQKAGDLYVRILLESLLENRELLKGSGGNVRIALFRLFHEIAERLIADPDCGADIAEAGVEARIQALPPMERRALLLSALEGFSQGDIATILDLSEEDVVDLLNAAWQLVNAQVATSVMIIEDEPVIALDVAGIVREIGHNVMGIAASHREALSLVRNNPPGLILADIDLGIGGSGLEAVQEILRHHDIPVIFVTAYPERLLTGERPEPTYLVTKPFETETLKVTISQALSVHAGNRVMANSVA